VSDGQRPTSLQARLSENDPRLYNVNRDVAHNFEYVANLVAGRLEDGLWPELDHLVRKHNISMDDLGEACQAFCLFIGAGVEQSNDMQEALDESGWFKVKPAAQVALMATLGTVILGMHFSGVREATLNGEGPAATLSQVAARGKETADYLAMPRWKRWFSRRFKRIKKAFAILRGR